MKSRIARIFFLTMAGLLGSAVSLMAASDGAVSAENDTELMFVGENTEVLSIASRYEEDAWQAPAVAEVITRKDIWENGVKTLSQALEMTPGFYMARKEWGSESYLRGIPDSTLLLYDTLVPMGSDITKTLQPIDYELSLAPVKRIEIVRGPGSVLWGPDAFAGIVNVVPLTGKDLDGVDAGVLYGGPGDRGAVYVNMGHDGGEWNGFLSLSGRTMEDDDTTSNIVRFWGDGEKAYPYEDRFGEKKQGRSGYLEASGSFSFKDWFTVSGLVSDYKKPYAISGPEESSGVQELTWPESRSGPFGFLKLEAKRSLTSSSGIGFAGYYNWMNVEYEIIDRSLDQREKSFYGELIYDHSFLTERVFLPEGQPTERRMLKTLPSGRAIFLIMWRRKKRHSYHYIPLKTMTTGSGPCSGSTTTRWEILIFHWV